MSQVIENKWPTDGHDHRHIDRSRIYENERIRAFLDCTNITFLIASKGMGKTLLMRVKKKLMTDANDGILLIPSSDREFDEPKLHGTYSSSGFSDLLLWKDLWSFSIVVSILTHLSAIAVDRDRWQGKLEKQFTNIPIAPDLKDKILADILENQEFLPSHYLSMLVARHSESELQRLRKAMHHIDDLSDRYINSGVCVFFDAFDQSLQESFVNNLEAWRDGQLGLLKAAHTLFTKNHHIKVYATIREEAWAGFIDQDKQVIRGKSLIWEPTENDLKALFVGAIRLYCDKRGVEDFLGIQKINNVFCSEYEDCFKYILRHSSRTPRSLMQFGKALDEAGLLRLRSFPDKLMRKIREVIDNTAADNVFEDYLQSEKRIFMKSLKTIEALNAFLNMLPSNVLTAASLRSIRTRFEAHAGIAHSEHDPFCELFNCGLLGQVRLDVGRGGEVQYFRKSKEFDWHVRELPGGNNGVYLLHPGLSVYLARAAKLRPNRFVIVEPDRLWNSTRGHVGIPIVFVSHSTIDKPTLEPFLDKLQDELNLVLPSELWIDRKMIIPGDHIHKEIERGLVRSDVLVLFASSASLKSGWVEHEWRFVHEKEIAEKQIRVIVAIIDETSPSELPETLRCKQATLCSTTNILGTDPVELASAIKTQAERFLDKLFEHSTGK